MAEGDRKTIQDEVAQLKEEITRISETTEFNGQKLLNGEFSLKGYTDELEVKVSSYSRDVPAKVYQISSLTVSEEVVNGEKTGNYTVDIDFANSTGFPEGATAEVRNGKDKMVTIKGANGFEMTLDLNNADFTNMPVTYNDIKVDATGIGAMRLQVGANEGQILAVDIPDISLRQMGIEDLDVSTRDGALEAIDGISGAIKFVSAVRGQLGAYQNRLESTVNSLDVTAENMTAAYSRIMDVDMAEEMTNYTTYQVLTQAGTSVLAQANQRPSQVLQLLQ